MYRSVDDSGREELINLCESISECEVAAKGRLCMLVDGAISSSETSAAISDAGVTGGTSGAGPSMLCLL